MIWLKYRSQRFVYSGLTSDTALKYLDATVDWEIGKGGIVHTHTHKRFDAIFPVITGLAFFCQ